MSTPESPASETSPIGPSSEMSASPTVPLPKLSADVAISPPDELEGKSLGAYRLDKKLGQGGFGSVYHARHATLKRETAIKLLSPQFAADASFVERFQREARAAARLEHVGVAQVYDVGEDQGFHYIAMQYVDGISLERLLDQRHKLSVNEVVSISKRVASALEYAHQQGIVHRDVKPGNILISKDSKVKVVDFGLARDLVEAGRVSVTGQIMGTPHFMSPEQGRGDKVDERSDIYALGATMYSMLTGKLPFDGNNAISVIMKHATDAVVPPVQLEPSVPQPLSDLIVAMMAKDPAARPQKMGDVARALEGMRDGRSTVIPAPQFAAPATVAFRGATTVASPPAPVAVAPPAKRRPWLLVGGAVLLVFAGMVGGTSMARKREQPTRSLEAAILFARDHAADPDAVIGRYHDVVAQSPNAPDVALKAMVLQYQALHVKARKAAEGGAPEAERAAAIMAEAAHLRQTLLEGFQHHASAPFAKETWVSFLQVESDVVRTRAEAFLRHCVAGDMRGARAFMDPHAPERPQGEDPKNPILGKLRKEGILSPDGKLFGYVIRDVGRLPELDEKIGQLEGACMRVGVDFKGPRFLEKLEKNDRVPKELPFAFHGDSWYLDPK